MIPRKKSTVCPSSLVWSQKTWTTLTIWSDVSELCAFSQVGATFNTLLWRNWRLGTKWLRNHQKALFPDVLQNRVQSLSLPSNCTKCAILLLWTCYQSFLFRIYQNQKERYPLDVCLFLFCGFCIMPQDIELAFPGHPRDGTPYASTRLSCLNPDYCCKFSNCLVCLSLCCMPIPSTV